MNELEFDHWRMLVARRELPDLAERLDALRPPWMRHAACHRHGTDAFFPRRGVSTAPARALCAACTVRTACLDHALADPELQGVWGGTSEQERRAMRGKRAA